MTQLAAANQVRRDEDDGTPLQKESAHEFPAGYEACSAPPIIAGDLDHTED